MTNEQTELVTTSLLELLIAAKKYCLDTLNILTRDERFFPYLVIFSPVSDWMKFCNFARIAKLSTSANLSEAELALSPFVPTPHPQLPTQEIFFSAVENKECI